MTRPILLLSSLLLLIFCITGCKHKKAKFAPSPAIYSSQQYSDCTVDSDFIKNELLRDTTLQPFAEDILDFYGRRNYEAAWIEGDTLTLSAHDFLNTLSSYASDFGDSSLTRVLDDTAIGAILMSGPTRGRTELDLKLTATFFRYAQRAYGGTSTDLKDLEWYIPRMKKDYLRLIDTLVTSPSSYSSYEPVNVYYKALKKALIRYRAIEKGGGLPHITTASLPLRKGDSTDVVIQVSKSLAATGDYTYTDAGSVYTDSLAVAVARYQQRMGLRETGIIDSSTLAEINVPIDARIRQIMLNMERLRWMPDSLPPAYLLVNIPEYRLHVSQHGQDTFSMDAVVGMAAHETSIFTGRLSVVAFSPYWNVPVSIIKNEMLPKLKHDRGYLSRENLEVLSHGTVIDPSDINWDSYKITVPFEIRQKPGPKNSLGLVAFFFPNTFDIYLHDTPAQSLFSKTDRAFSHGCIRLAEPEKLADYIFRKDSTMQPDHIRELMDAHVERKFSVKPSIPVYIVYFTAWVDHAGHICFRHDIYGHDAVLAREIFGR